MIKTLLSLQALAFVVLGIVVADLYAHKRVEMVGGTNIWGYRGPVAKQRSDDEYRILLVGGTRAYGYGAAADGTIAYALGWELSGRMLRPVNVINAAAMGATAPDFAMIVSRYLALAPDVVCLYDDLGRASGRRRESRVARIARGYTPILPLVLEEKGMAWRYGSVARAYAGEPPTTGWLRRTAGASLQWVGSALSFLDSEIAPSSPDDYAPSILAAADAALSGVSHVLVVVDPPADNRTQNNLTELQAAVAGRADSRISLLVLAGVGGPDTLLDGYSYNAVGRSRVEMAIRAELLKLLSKKL
jgi:hypothetical protein